MLFDITSDFDLLLPSVRESYTSIDGERAERDVLAAYKHQCGVGWRVLLTGYYDNPMDTELEQALKETIADVISYRLAQGTRDSGDVKREKLGDYEIEYSRPASVTSRASGFPTNWSYRLARFDRRPRWHN